MKKEWIELILAFILGAVFVWLGTIITSGEDGKFCLPYSSGNNMMNFGQTNVPYCYDERYDNSSTCWVRENEPIPFNGSIGIDSGKLILVAKGSHKRVIRSRLQTSLPDDWKP